MQLGYNVVLVLSSIFCTYILYNTMKVFFNEQATSNRVLIEVLVLFEVSNILVLNYISVPMLLLLCNFIFFYLMSYCFKATIQKRIIFAAVVIILFNFAEFVSYFIIYGSETKFFENNEYISNSLGIFTSTMLKYLVFLMINNFKKDAVDKVIPRTSWFSIVLLLACSLAISIVISYREANINFVIVTTVWLLIVINILVLNLYYKLNHYYVDEESRRLLELKNKYYEQQLLTIEASNNTIKSAKHDIINKLTLLKLCIDKGDYERANAYILKETKKLNGEKIYVETNNFEMDGILNFKINEMMLSGIKVNLDMRVSSKINAKDMDLLIIFGNLLDNAAEACEKVNGYKYVDIVVAYSKACLVIKIANPYVGNIEMDKGKIITVKKDKEFHGIGLKNIENAVKDYKGSVDFNYDNSRFEVKVIMYL